MIDSEKYAELTALPLEVQLLILASRLELEAEDARLFDDILTSGPDWERVMSFGARMVVQPLLYRHLSSPDRAGRVPGEVLRELNTAYRKTSLRNLLTHGQIQALVERVRASGIPMLLLKGSALSRWIYGDMGIRPMSDVDVLCREEDIRRLEGVLHRLGYAQRTTGSYSRLHAAVGQERSHLPPYDHPKGVRIEVHLNLFGKEGGDAGLMDSVWRHAQDLTVDGLQFRTLSDEHMLLHLCLHLHHHITVGNIALYWFCDIFEFVRKMQGRMDWQAFWSMVQALGVEDKAGVIFTILHACWGLDLPPEMPHLAKEDLPPLRSIFDPECAAQTRLLHFLPARTKLLKEVAAKYGLAASAGYAFRILFPTGNYIRTRYAPATRAQFVRCYVRHAYERLHRTAVSVWLQIVRQHP